jgi:quinol monooxygenase YgiN
MNFENRGLFGAIAAGVVAASLMAATGDAQAQGGPAPAPAPAAASAGPVHVVQYLDFPVTAAVQGINLLKRYRDEIKKLGASNKVEIYQESGRRGRFAIEETWRDTAVMDAAAKDKTIAALNAEFGALMHAPADKRLHDPYSMNAGTASGGVTAVTVYTHVDVPPPLLAQLEPLLKQLADDSRKEPGSVRFDVLQQSSRKNHFTVAETWQTTKAQYLHDSAANARKFREKLGPMLGALYDQRIYTVIK